MSQLLTMLYLFSINLTSSARLISDFQVTSNIPFINLKRSRAGNFNWQAGGRYVGNVKAAIKHAEVSKSHE